MCVCVILYEGMSFFGLSRRVGRVVTSLGWSKRMLHSSEAAPKVRRRDVCLDTWVCSIYFYHLWYFMIFLNLYSISIQAIYGTKTATTLKNLTMCRIQDISPQTKLHELRPFSCILLFSYFSFCRRSWCSRKGRRRVPKESFSHFGGAAPKTAQLCPIRSSSLGSAKILSKKSQ